MAPRPNTSRAASQRATPTRNFARSNELVLSGRVAPSLDPQLGRPGGTVRGRRQNRRAQSAFNGPAVGFALSFER
jgi:hypothetical protein